MILSASAERERRDHNDRAWQAHTTAYLASYHPRKPAEFPKLAKLQMSAKADRRRAPAKHRWEDDFAMMQAWTQGHS